MFMYVVFGPLNPCILVSLSKLRAHEYVRTHTHLPGIVDALGRLLPEGEAPDLRLLSHTVR